MFKVLRFAADAALVTAFLAAIKRGHGIGKGLEAKPELRTDGIENEDARKVVKTYLAAGDYLIDGFDILN
jgi:hypothetical protein